MPPLSGYHAPAAEEHELIRHLRKVVRAGRGGVQGYDSDNSDHDGNDGGGDHHVSPLLNVLDGARSLIDSYELARARAIEEVEIEEEARRRDVFYHTRPTQSLLASVLT